MGAAKDDDLQGLRIRMQALKTDDKHPFKKSPQISLYLSAIVEYHLDISDYTNYLWMKRI